MKAIVLRVDSPGGSALASDLMWNELRGCKKPVVASMSDVAASGGYYISMAAKKIYAEPGTLTGSIGVVGGKIALAGLYDKVGITTDVIQRGANVKLYEDFPYVTDEGALEERLKDFGGTLEPALVEMSEMLPLRLEAAGMYTSQTGLNFEHKASMPKLMETYTYSIRPVHTVHLERYWTVE